MLGRERLRGLLDSAQALLKYNAIHEMPRRKRLLARNLRVVAMVLRWEVYNRIKLHAQALTYDSLLAVVPLLVVVFAIFKGFGTATSITRHLNESLLVNLTGSPEVQQAVANYVERYFSSIQAGSIGAISIIILIVSVISLLGHIESAFNAVFGASDDRPITIRLLTYWAVLTFGPLLLAASFAGTAALQSTQVAAYIDELGSVSTVLLWAAPLLATWVALTSMYLFVPNTRVHFWPALVAAIIAGSLWNLGKFLYAIYASNAITLQNVYGSLAVIPIFILWLYVSWLVVLFGAQLAFAFQNASTYRTEDEPERASHSFIERAACRVLLEVSRDFGAGRPPPDLEVLMMRLRLPRRLLESLIGRLRHAGYLQSTEPNGALLPAIDPERVTVATLLQQLRLSDAPDPKLVENEAHEQIDRLLARVDEELSRLAAVSFRELAARYPPAPVAEEQTEDEATPVVAPPVNGNAPPSA